MWPLVLLAVGVAPDLDHARFYGRTWSSELPLEVSSFVVFVDTTRETVRSRLRVEVANATASRVEAVLRLPIPPSASVTSAVLYMDERPMSGHLMSSDEAHDIYHTIVDRKMDPMLVSWAGPEAIDISIFPVEPMGRRRFEIEWVEPRGRSYRLPVVAEQGRVLGRPTLAIVDGSFEFPDGRDWLALDSSPASQSTPCAALIVGTEPTMFDTADQRLRANAQRRATLEEFASCPHEFVTIDGIGSTAPDYLLARAQAIGARDVYFIDRGFASAPAELTKHFALQTVTGETFWMQPPDGSRGDLGALWARFADNRPARVVTPDVSILVLEHEQDYARWSRPAPAPVATSPSGVGARRASHAPQIMLGLVSVRGSLDKYSIRSYVSRHVVEVRHCYEQELITDHRLRGRVVLRLVLDSSLGGAAISVSLPDSTLENPAVEHCIVEHARKWEFPLATGGGIVEINYPLVLQPLEE
jgi:hypothetical protein